MPRARNLKPGFFKNDELAETGPLGMLLFEGLWTMADRDGRLEDRPLRIKAEVLPYFDADVDGLLSALAERGFVRRYVADGQRLVQVENFGKHQTPHPKEPASSLPAYDSTPSKHRQDSGDPLAKNADSLLSDVLTPDVLTPDVLTPDTGLRTADKPGADAPADAVAPDRLAKPPTYPADFEVFWREYPRGRGGKVPTFEAWKRLKLTAETKAEVMAGLARWKACEMWRDPTLVVYADRWLKEHRWADDPPPPKGPSNGRHPPATPFERSQAAFAAVEAKMAAGRSPPDEAGAIEIEGRVAR